MKSGYTIFALLIISMTLTSAVTMMLVSEYGIGSEENPLVRFLFRKLGILTFPVFDVGGVLFVYLILTTLRKFDAGVASAYLLSVVLLSVCDLAHDAHVFVTHNSPFPSFAFFLLVPVLAILSFYLFYTNRVSSLEF